MPVFIQGGHGQANFDAIAFGVPTQANLNFLEERLTSFSNTMAAAGEAFVNRGLQVFEKYGGSEAIRLAKAAVRTVQHAFDSDCVRELKTLGSVQQAGQKMQRWIMASPGVRELYHRQQCDGYSNSYVDVAPDSIGRDHYDWRLVNTGLVEETPDDPEYEWQCVNYLDESAADVQLSVTEKIEILSTWDFIKTMMLPGKEDPTSPFCGKL